jgi:hypothetical protein
VAQGVGGLYESLRETTVNGKTPLYVTLLSLALLGGTLLLFQPYRAGWPGTAYAEPARRYIRAASGRTRWVWCVCRRHRLRSPGP